MIKKKIRIEKQINRMKKNVHKKERKKPPSRSQMGIHFVKL